MIVVDAPQRSPAWFEARLGKPTASNFGDVLAVSKVKKTLGEPLKARADYAHRLVAERLCGPAPQVTTGYMQRGIAQEPDVLAAYELRTGFRPEPVGFCLDTTEMFGASPDGLVGSDGLVECKTTLPHLFIELMLSGGAIEKHRAQMVGQCLVTGRAWVDLALWCEPLGALYVARLEPSVAEREAMYEALLEFCVYLDSLEARALDILRDCAVSPLDAMPEGL